MLFSGGLYVSDVFLYVNWVSCLGGYIPDCPGLELHRGARDDGGREDALLAAILDVLGDGSEVTGTVLR